MSAVASATESPRPQQLNAEGRREESVESLIFRENVDQDPYSSETALSSAPSRDTFWQKVSQVMELKGEQEWADLFAEKSTAKTMGEFFKYIETTTKDIVHNQTIDEKHLPLARSMIQFLAEEICQSSSELMWNLWLFRETKSDLRASIDFVLQDVLGIDKEIFETAQAALLEKNQPIKKASFFQLIFGNDGFASLYQYEHLITLDPVQILLLLASAYPKQPSSKPTYGTELRQKRPSSEPPQRTIQVKPLQRTENGACSQALPLIGAVAAVVFAIYAMT